ncbi:MAG: outer membrane protein [Bacteroidia bacterium]
MKKLSIAILALAAGLGPLAAADLAQRPIAPLPVMMPPPFSWTGFYLGGNVGGAWTNLTVTELATNAVFNPNNASFIGGGQLGYNYQFLNNFVVGVEWDFDWGGHNSSSNVVTTPLGNLQASVNGANWLTTLAGRVGYAWDRVLVYGKGGGGWLETSTNFNNLTTGAVATTHHTSTGWLLGAGVEYALSPHWTTKFEYDYLGSGTWQSPTLVVPGGMASVKGNIQTFKVGINYKF